MNPITPPLVRLGVPAAALAFFACAVHAQVIYAPMTNVAVGNQPSGVVAVDLNGDGHADLATTVDVPDSIVVRLNDGVGNFSTGPASALPNSSSAQDLVAGDFDGDKDMDLAVAIRDPQGAVLIMLNNGAGSFVQSASIAVGDRPRGLAAADMDGDGDIDLAVANRDDGTASVLTNTPAGFTAVTIAVGGETRATAFGDFDGDGDLDLAVTEQDTRAVYTFTNTLGVFTAAAVLSTGPFTRPDGVTAADLNGDLMTDIVAAVSDNTLNIHQAAVYLRTGPGVFAAQVGYDTNGTDPADVIAADIDCDGALDLVLSNQTSNNLSTLRNAGAGTFAVPVVSAVGTEPDFLAAADFDGDGDLDVAVEAKLSNAITVLMNESCATAPCPGDTNGDGMVNVNDLNNVILDWGTNGAANGGDITGPAPGSPPDGIVNVNDLNAVIVNWGICP